jgi:fatty acid desaturase
MFTYIKFGLFHIIGIFAGTMLFIGGDAVHIALASIVALLVGGDVLLGNDDSTPDYTHPNLLTWLLYSALPIVIFLWLGACYFISGSDPLNIGSTINGFIHNNVTAENILAIIDAPQSIGQIVSAVILFGLMIGTIGTISAHELTHRTWDKLSMFIGRWLLAFSFDTAFSIEHVYGHHRYVSTVKDPGTAPRGRTVYAHIIISTIKGNISAWQIENKRLKRRNLNVLSLSNVLVRGYLMSAFILLITGLIAGPIAVVFVAVAGIYGKAMLEIVNYIEHYGLERDVKQKVEPYHSWNTNKRISSWAMFNLTRHSHHHARGNVPFHELKPYPDAPMMVTGYLGTMMLTLIPPLWFWLMKPKLKAWDEKYKV